MMLSKQIKIQAGFTVCEASLLFPNLAPLSLPTAGAHSLTNFPFWLGIGVT